MKIALIIKIAGLLYNHGLRDLLKEFIEDPDSSWDDQLIKALDQFFNYKEKK